MKNTNECARSIYKSYSCELMHTLSRCVSVLSLRAAPQIYGRPFLFGRERFLKYVLDGALIILVIYDLGLHIFIPIALLAHTLHTRYRIILPASSPGAQSRVPISDMRRCRARMQKWLAASNNQLLHAGMRRRSFSSPFSRPSHSPTHPLPLHIYTQLGAQGRKRRARIRRS